MFVKLNGSTHADDCYEFTGQLDIPTTVMFSNNLLQILKTAAIWHNRSKNKIFISDKILFFDEM